MRERLRAGGEIDDAQAPVPERGVVVEPGAGFVGAAVGDHVAHARQPRALVVPQPVGGDHSCDSAHGQAAPLCTDAFDGAAAATAARDPGPCHTGQPPSSANCRNQSSSISSCQRRWR